MLTLSQGIAFAKRCENAVVENERWKRAAVFGTDVRKTMDLLRRENRIVKVSKNKIIRKTITDGFVMNVENVASTKIIILRIFNIKMEEASNPNEINIMEELLNVNQQGVTGTA